MEFLIFLIVAAAVVAGVFWAKKHIRNEIDRAKRINRANKNKSRRVPQARAFRARLRACSQ
jgi:hypothetical protein